MLNVIGVALVVVRLTAAEVAEPVNVLSVTELGVVEITPPVPVPLHEPGQKVTWTGSSVPPPLADVGCSVNEPLQDVVPPFEQSVLTRPTVRVVGAVKEAGLTEKNELTWLVIENGPEPPTVTCTNCAPAESATELGVALNCDEPPDTTVKVAALEADAPGFTTVTVRWPCTAMKPAGTVAVSWLAVTKVVESVDPPHSTTAPGVKPLPVTVRVNPGPPATTDGGLRPVIWRLDDCGLMVRMTALEVPERPGLITVTIAVPGTVNRLAGTCAVSRFELPNASAVDRGDPFHCTLAPNRNPVPYTARLKPGLPATIEDGVTCLIEGMSGLMLKVTAFEAPPPGFNTLMDALPSSHIRPTDTLAFSWVGLTNVVGSGAPFHKAVEPETKPVPLIVSVNAGPAAVTEAGFNEAMLWASAGTGRRSQSARRRGFRFVHISFSLHFRGLPQNQGFWKSC